MLSCSAMTGSKSGEKGVKPAKITGVMSRISDMIPPPDENNAHTDSGGEDWN